MSIKMKKILISVTLASLILVFALINSNSAQATGFIETIERKAVKINSVNDVENLTDNIKQERIVLLGESTHGTSQYYSMRAEISKHLIKEHGFSFIAVEGDWAAIYKLNLYVKGMADSNVSVQDIMKSFNRWPKWMWANRETAEFIEWIKQYNNGKDFEDMVGFYGIDVYGQWEAMDNLIEYAKNYFPKEHNKIKENANCFRAFGDDEWNYARAVNSGSSSCESELKEIIELLINNRENLKNQDSYKYLNALQSAYVLKNSEAFYRLSPQQGSQSWNARATHFYNTVRRLMDFYDDNSKAVVWAHNTHVGDARATPMVQNFMTNIGMLAREDLGAQNVYIIGFSTYSGTVVAGRAWAEPMEKMRIPNAVEGSLEYKLNSLGKESFFINFNKNYSKDHEIMQPIGHRAIGVTYNPQNDVRNYVPTVLPQRYNAVVFFQNTTALNVLQ